MTNRVLDKILRFGDSGVKTQELEVRSWFSDKFKTFRKTTETGFQALACSFKANGLKSAILFFHFYFFSCLSWVERKGYLFK